MSPSPSVLAGRRLASCWRILGPVGLVQALLPLNDALLMGVGRSRKVFLLSLLSASMTVVSILVGARFGLQGVAVAVAASVMFTVALSLYASLRGFPLTLW